MGSGGAGVALTITKAFPQIVATAVDLPRWRRLLKDCEEEGATERVKVVAADVLSGPLVRRL